MKDKVKIIKNFNSKNNLTLKQAKSIAQDFVVKQIGGASKRLVLQSKKTEKRMFGYVFFYTTKEYLKTGDTNNLIPGIGPIVVNYSGKVFFISSSVEPIKAIKEYEEQWLKK